MRAGIGDTSYPSPISNFPSMPSIFFTPHGTPSVRPSSHYHNQQKNNQKKQLDTHKPGCTIRFLFGVVWLSGFHTEGFSLSSYYGGRFRVQTQKDIPSGAVPHHGGRLSLSVFSEIPRKQLCFLKNKGMQRGTPRRYSYEKGCVLLGGVQGLQKVIGFVSLQQRSFNLSWLSYYMVGIFSRGFQ